MNQIILPDSPSSVMQLFDADKQALMSFAANIVNSVIDGNENALKVQVLVKKQEFVLEKIKEGIKEGRNEGLERTIITFMKNAPRYSDSDLAVLFEVTPEFIHRLREKMKS